MEKPLEQAISTITDVFNKYADKSGDEYIMRKRNLKELIQNEMNVGPILQKPEYRSLMADLDRNEDERVDLPYYASIICKVFILVNPQ